jgi:hypothetical protein
MATYLVHDSRVTGRMPHGLADAAMSVNRHTHLSGMISGVARYADSHGGTISRLYILAHGKYQQFEAETFQMTFRTGGCGIQICNDDLTVGNLALLNQWRGKVTNITLFSCGIAAVNPQIQAASDANRARGNGQMSTRYDGINGELFCREFANASGANVTASDLEQDYAYYVNPIERLFGIPGEIQTETLNQMEGNVRTFRPNR